MKNVYRNNRPRSRRLFAWHSSGLLFLLIFLPVSHLLAEEPLGWKFKVGDEHHYRLTQQMNMAMFLGPAGELETSVQQKMDMVWKVVSLDDQGTASLLQQINRVQLEITGPGSTEITYDSQLKDMPIGYGAMIDPAIKVWIANPIQLTMTPQGKIVSISIPEKVSKAITIMPGAEMIRVFLTAEGYRDVMQQLSLVLPPATALVPDYQWTTNQETLHPELGKITAGMTYQYKGNRTEAGQVYENFFPKLELDFGESKEQNPSQMKAKEQDSKGNILFNRTSGWLESSKLEQTMKLFSSETQPVEQTIDLKIEFNRVPPPQEGSPIN